MTSADAPADSFEAQWARIAHMTERLNAGDPEPLLEGYADDVTVVAALGEHEDPATDFVLHGKAAYRHFLLTFLEHHGGFDMTGLNLEPRRALLDVLTRSGERKRLDVSLDEAGLGTRVAVLQVSG